MKSSTTALLLACVVLAGCSQLASPINELTPTPTPELEDSTTSPPTTEPSTSELPTPETAETRTPTAASTQPRTSTATATTITPTIPTAPATTTAVPTTATPSATTVRTPERPTATVIPTSKRTASPPSTSVRLAIAEIDARNETVTFRNVGERPLDLGGYVVDFDDGQQYTFPRYTLEPGATVALHTGRGDSAGSELYAGFFYPVLNADGDTLLVVSPTGEIVLARRVPATPDS